MAVLPSSDSTLLPSQYQPVPSRKQPQAPSNDTVAAIAAGHQPASSFPSLEEDHSKLQPKAGLPVPSHVTLHVSSLSEPRPKPQLKRLGSKSPTQPSPRLTSSTTDIAARRQCKDTQEARDNHNAIERARRDNLNQQFLVCDSGFLLFLHLPSLPPRPMPFADNIVFSHPTVLPFTHLFLHSLLASGSLSRHDTGPRLQDPVHL